MLWIHLIGLSWSALSFLNSQMLFLLDLMDSLDQKVALEVLELFALTKL